MEPNKSIIKVYALEISCACLWYVHARVLAGEEGTSEHGEDLPKEPEGEEPEEVEELCGKVASIIGRLCAVSGFAATGAWALSPKAKRGSHHRAAECGEWAFSCRERNHVICVCALLPCILSLPCHPVLLNLVCTQVTCLLFFCLLFALHNLLPLSLLYSYIFQSSDLA